MTYRAQDVENIVVLDAKLSAGEVNGDYVRLGDGEPRRVAGVLPQCPYSRCNSVWWWIRVVLLCVCLFAAAVPLIIFAGPLIIKKVVVPFLNWEMATFSRPVLGLLLFVCIALFPTMILPSSPCMWIAGMTFGYGYGFLLIMAGSSIGMSLPFFVGSFFRHNIHRWLEKWPKKAAIVKLAGEGDWFHQFRAVVLLRISPFPYIIFNYAAVATNVEYGPYISGSLVGTIHETFITIYSDCWLLVCPLMPIFIPPRVRLQTWAVMLPQISEVFGITVKTLSRRQELTSFHCCVTCKSSGRLLQSLADATNTGGFLSLEQVIYDVIGFCIAAAATSTITIYAKRTLQTLQVEDELS